MEAQGLGYHWRKSYTGEIRAQPWAVGKECVAKWETFSQTGSLLPVSLMDTGAEGKLAAWLGRLGKGASTGTMLIQPLLAQKTAKSAGHLGPAHTCTE